MDKHQVKKGEAVRAGIEAKLTSHFGVSPEEATEEQIFKATALSVKELLTAKRQVFHDRVLGPDKPGVARVKSLCIRKLVVKLENGVSLRQARENLRKAQMMLANDQRFRLVQVYFDVDPL